MAVNIIKEDLQSKILENTIIIKSVSEKGVRWRFKNDAINNTVIGDTRSSILTELYVNYNTLEGISSYLNIEYLKYLDIYNNTPIF